VARSVGMFSFTSTNPVGLDMVSTSVFTWWVSLLYCCIFGGWPHVRMICLDRRVVLHCKHTMVHLLSFWGS
jgi:hypothetical protein